MTDKELYNKIEVLKIERKESFDKHVALDTKIKKLEELFKSK